MHGQGSGATAGSKRAGGIGGGADSAAPVRLGSVGARRPASRRRYWGGRIGGAGAMETPCQSLAGSANQDCDRSAQAISAPPCSRQRPPFSGGLRSILQNLEEEKTGQWMGEKDRRESSRSLSLPPPALLHSHPPQEAVMLQKSTLGRGAAWVKRPPEDKEDWAKTKSSERTH